VFGVSIDGAHQETYEQYRRGGKLDTVLANCRLMRDAKRRLGSATPLLIWEFHVFSHNTDDIERARALAAELEMGIAVVKGWVAGLRPSMSKSASNARRPSPGSDTVRTSRPAALSTPSLVHTRRTMRSTISGTAGRPAAMRARAAVAVEPSPGHHPHRRRNEGA